MNRTKREARDAEIWQRYLDGMREPLELAIHFGVSETLVKQILGENYFHKTQGPPTKEDYVRNWLMQEEIVELRGSMRQRVQAVRRMMLEVGGGDRI